MLRIAPKKLIILGMKKENLELYTDYLISNSGYATATGLSAMLDGEVSHDKVTRFLSEREYTSKDLWREVKSTVRQIEREEGCLIFDDAIQEKEWTDENEIMCWHYDHCHRGVAIFAKAFMGIPAQQAAKNTRPLNACGCPSRLSLDTP